MKRISKSIIALSEEGDKILGLLRLITISIGSEDGLPVLKIDNKDVLQARIMDFYFTKLDIITNSFKALIGERV